MTDFYQAPITLPKEIKSHPLKFPEISLADLESIEPAMTKEGVFLDLKSDNFKRSFH